MEQQVEASGGSANKALLVGGLVIGLLLGGGGAYFVLGQKDTAPEVAHEEVVEEPEPLNLVENGLKPIAVPIFGEVRGRKQFLGNYFIDITILAIGPEGNDYIEAHKPQIRHALIDEISKRPIMQDDNPLVIDNTKAQASLKARLQQILDKEKFHDVLIINVIRQAS